MSGSPVAFRPVLCAMALGVAAACLPVRGAARSPIFREEKLPVGELSEEWVLASETSAAVYWQSENRARSTVAYGPTEACERKTPLSPLCPVTRQPFWSHFHRIPGLKPGTRCFYRRVCVGTDGQEVRSEVKSLQTRQYAEAIRVPDDVPGPPYVLDREGATYVLTRDLACPLGGIEVKAPGITLDLDGHTLVYNAEPAERPAEWTVRAYKENDCGVKVTHRGGRARILNGVIRQGEGNSAGTQVGIGCNPVYSRSAPVELAGVEIAWAGRDISGLVFHWGRGSHVHHCVMEDRGSEITNRHQAISTIDGNAWGDYDHNLVKRTRQQALMGAAKATHNEIYIDSHATNAFGIVPSRKAERPIEVAHNRILGIGEHPVGIALFGLYEPGSSVHHNTVEVECTRSGAEYGYTGSACFRTTWGADNLHVAHNTFIGHAAMHGQKVAKTRVLWVGLPAFKPRGVEGAKEIADARGLFYDNRIVARGRDGAKAGGICVVCLNESPNLIFHSNTVVSTWGNVLLGDEYGHAGGFPKFFANVFRREGDAPGYFTIRQDYAGRPATAVFLGNVYEAGAGREAIKLLEKGEIAFQALLDLRVADAEGEPLGGARVVITDSTGAEVFAGVTPAGRTEAMVVARPGPSFAIERPLNKTARNFVEPMALEKGRLLAVLTTHVATAKGETARTPHTVKVSKPGYKDGSREVQAGAATRVEIALRR
ncbi:MAG: fibronectin type III domain-containing protein [bacterium]